MVDHMLADIGKFVDTRNTQRFQLALVPNSGVEQDLRRTDNAR